MSAFPTNEESRVRSLKLKQQLENDSGFNDLTHVTETTTVEKDIDLPSFSESTHDNNIVTTKKQQPQQRRQLKTKAVIPVTQQIIQEELKTLNDEEFFKSNLKLIEREFVQSKNLRDKVIVKEIDKMFRSIRDHQSASVKAKCDDKSRKNGSWGYSSSKRHVKAKVMELPFAEDLDILAKRIGINELNEIEYAFDDKEDMIERVFVRIDDFLNVEISQVLQRSYSADYLNDSMGPRTRISDVKIPTIQTMNNQSLLTLEEYTSSMNKNRSLANKNLNESSTDFREAPYDLRYWSILKLLEEERKSEDGQLLTYFDDPKNKKEEWPTHNDVMREILSKRSKF